MNTLEIQQVPAHIDNDKIIIQKGREPQLTKETFFRIMEQRVRKLDRNSYAEIVGPLSSRSHFAHVRGIVFETPGEKTVRDAIIYVNEDDFYVDGEDFTDLIPISVRHEIFELWMYAKTGWSLSPIMVPVARKNMPSAVFGFAKRISKTRVGKYIGDKYRGPVAHNLALREEYRYAFEMGKAERYLEFIKRASASFPEFYRKKGLKENEEAYNKVKSRFKK